MSGLTFLQNWALGVCLACAAAGVLQQFFTARSGVIKLVLTLYILVTALGTAGSAGGLEGVTDAFDTPAAGPGRAELDVQSLTLAQAQAALEQTLAQSLAESGAAVKSVSVQLAVSGNGEVDVEQVTVIAWNEAACPAAEAIVRAALGKDVDVVAATPRQEGDGG